MNETDNTDFDGALLARARELATDIAPPRDLWPDIDAEISVPATSSRNWQRLFAQAAAVIVLVGASAGLTWLAVKDDGVDLSPVVATNSPRLDAAPAGLGQWEMFNPDAQDARRSVEQRLEERLALLPPATREEVTTNLQTIRSAITDINAALASEPDNALLRQLLLSSYGQELAVMRRVNAISRPMMIREDI